MDLSTEMCIFTKMFNALPKFANHWSKIRKVIALIYLLLAKLNMENINFTCHTSEGYGKAGYLWEKSRNGSEGYNIMSFHVIWGTAGVMAGIYHVSEQAEQRCVRGLETYERISVWSIFINVSHLPKRFG